MERVSRSQHLHGIDRVRYTRHPVFVAATRSPQSVVLHRRATGPFLENEEVSGFCAKANSIRACEIAALSPRQRRVDDQTRNSIKPECAAPPQGAVRTNGGSIGLR
jgi:hypothetical protein